MNAAARQLRPLFQVALPVVVAVVLVCLAVLNMALVKTWPGEAEDGVLWGEKGIEIIAADVAPGSAAERAGLRRGDVLVTLNEESTEITGEWRIPGNWSGTFIMVREARQQAKIERKVGETIDR